MTQEEIKKELKELFRAMAELKTPYAIDSKGNIWSYGPWYGEKRHFRTNFGHWS